MNNLIDYLKQNYKLPLYTGYNTMEPKAKNYGLCCLKIDLNRPHNINIGFYKDTVMDQKGALYTLNNIPKECITIDKKITKLLNE